MTRKKTEKLLILLLCAIFIGGLLISCQSPDESGNNQNNPVTENSEQSDNQTAEAETEKLIPDLPDINYDGYEFNILVTSDEGDLVRNDFYAESLTGEVINDAKYMRNSYVEEKYGVKINNISAGWKVGEGVTRITKSAAAGDFAYDAAMVSVYDACNLVLAGLTLDLNSMPYIDLSQPWWDQKANLDLNIRGGMYFTTGDISQVVNDATYAVLFNKNLVRDYELEDPYTLVKSGTWTYDKIAELGSSVHSDLNGDGIYNQFDLYGAIVEDDTMMSMVNSIGEKCADINSAGIIELTIYNERVVSAFEKYTDWVFDKTVVYAYQRDGLGDENFIRMYENNQALFLLRGMHTITELRAMETDFGILPFPKLDNKQSEYHSAVGSWHSMFLCVPNVQADVERSGIILEALAAESRYTLRPAYYDISLKGKHARDEESVDMLDIILSSRIYDFGWYYQFGGYNNEIMNLIRNYNSEFTSMYEKNVSKAQTDIQKVNDKFSELLG